jgi:hypothetical protein
MTIRTLTLLVAASSLALSGCSTFPRADYCSQNPVVCAAVGAAVVGGVILLVHSESDGSSPPPAPSDARLKQDLKRIETLPNGLPLYAFHYKGDSRWFSGVLAQDVFARPDLAHAVSRGADGFLRVNYAALGLGLYNLAAINDASGRALAIAAN